MTSKATVVAILVAAVLVAGSIFLVASRPGGADRAAAPANNVSIVDGKQFIDLTAKGGYAPMRSSARAGIPTVLRVTTRGTFDCSSALRIPSLDVSRSLPASGVTEIDLGTPQAGTLQGTCGMGMYPFEVNFEDSV